MSRKFVIPSKAHNFVRAVRSIAAGRGNLAEAIAFAEKHYGPQGTATALVRKANEITAGGARPSASWAGELGDYNESAAAFFGLVHEQTILGRIESLRRVPFRTRLIGSTAGPTTDFVGENKAIRVARFTLSEDRLDPLSLGAITVLSNELVKGSDQAGERYIYDELLKAQVECFDARFIDPDNAGESEVTPAAITYGAPTIASTGEASDDIRRLISHFDGDLTSAYFVLHPTTAANMALPLNDSQPSRFPNLGANGGSILGIPALTSRSVANSTSGGIIALVDGAGIGYGEGVAEVYASQSATVEMSAAPVADGNVPTGQTQNPVSMFQEELVAIRCTQVVNWKRVRSNAVTVLSGVDYAWPGT
jgi:hypothetical protein